MKDSKKKEFLMCCVAELKTLETHFARMAEKGWMIDKVNMFSCEYKKTEPQELQFFVDILPQVTAFDYPENDDVQEYRRICTESGWTFVDSSKQMQLFYAEKKCEMPIPIHTDSKIEAQIMLKTCRKYELVFFLMGLIYLWFMWGWSIGNGYDLFLSNTTMAQAVAVVVFTPPFLWYVGFILIWYFKTMVHVKKGLPSPRVNYKLARIRGAVFIIAAISVIAVMIMGILLDVFGGAPTAVLAVAIFPIAGIFITLFIRKQIDTKNRTRKANKRMFIAGTTAVVILSIAINAFVILRIGQGLSDVQSLPADRIALKLTDFGVKTPPRVYNYYRHDSIAVLQNYTYYEINADGSVHTDVKKAVNTRIAHGIFQNAVEKYSKQKWRSLTEMRLDEAKMWGAIAGYYLDETYTNLLLLYEKAVLQIEYSGKGLQSESIQEKVKSMGR